VEADTNAAPDVYEWHNGTVALISDGLDPAGADPRGAALTKLCAPTISPSGSDIFFTTRARLVGTDADSLADVYDARVGGGFPYSPPAACEDAEGCRGPAGPAPSLGAPASSTNSGVGNPAVPAPRRMHHRQKKHHKKHHKKRKHHRQKKKHHRHGKHLDGRRQEKSPRKARHDAGRPTAEKTHQGEGR
jgi:hypothetical protein